MPEAMTQQMINELNSTNLLTVDDRLAIARGNALNLFARS
jgi:hypothetical protein